MRKVLDVSVLLSCLVLPCKKHAVAVVVIQNTFEENTTIRAKSMQILNNFNTDTLILPSIISVSWSCNPILPEVK